MRQAGWTTIHRMGKLPTAVLLLAVALTGCGGNEDEKATGDDRPDTSATPDSPPSITDDSTAASSDPSPDVAADQAIVDASVLTLKDMPAGWTAQAPDDEDENVEGKTKIAKCVGLDYDDLYNDTNPSAESDEFTSPEEKEVSVEVGLSATEEWMTNAFEIFSSSKFRECVVSSLEEDFESEDGVEVGEISINEMSFNPIGDEVSAFRMTMPLSSDGFDFEVIGDYVVVRIGRGQVVLSTFSLGSPLSVEEAEGFARLSVDRLAKGLAQS